MSGERVFYRDREAFNTALDAASESIRKHAGPDVLGQMLWWGAVGSAAALLVGDWAFDWKARFTLLPGVDLVKPVSMLVVGLLVYHHLWTRNRHGRILRDRLCLKCGAGLGDVSTDDEGDGTCPQCERAFNLGEYRRPSENRSAGFHGYLDADHFDRSIHAAAEQIRRTRGQGLESDALQWSWLCLGACFVARIIFDWDLFDWMPLDVPWVPVLAGVLLAWSAWLAIRVRRLQPAIIAEHLCMNCGFCLEHAATDGSGQGRCPECGDVFDLRQYERPAGDETPAG